MFMQHFCLTTTCNVWEEILCVPARSLQNKLPQPRHYFARLLNQVSLLSCNETFSLCLIMLKCVVCNHSMLPYLFSVKHLRATITDKGVIQVFFLLITQNHIQTKNSFSLDNNLCAAKGDYKKTSQ